MPADSVLLPFLRGTAQYAVRKRRRPSERFQPNREPTMNCCQGARAKVCPAHSPLEWRRNPRNSIACRAAALSSLGGAIGACRRRYYLHRHPGGRARPYHAVGGVSRSSRRCLRLSQYSGERRGGCAADRAHSARTASAAAAGGRSVEQIHCAAPRHNSAHSQVPRRLHRGKIGRYGADRCGGQSHAFGARHDLKLESSG
jgi:hypothetical protein